MREDGIKAAGLQCNWFPEGALSPQADRQEHGECSDQRQREHESVALIKAPERSWPRVFGVSHPAYPSHRLGNIDAKRVGRCVLAGMQAGAAVMAQICEVMNIGLRKFEAPGHGWKNGAITFAIAACIADFHLPSDLGLGFANQRFKRQHEISPERWRLKWRGLRHALRCAPRPLRQMRRQYGRISFRSSCRPQPCNPCPRRFLP